MGRGDNKTAVKKDRIILVHGACHGAWCWHKMVARLASEGHTVSAIDLTGSGIDTRKIPEDVAYFSVYAKQLMDLMASLSTGEQVVLVGHSFGGLALALAMESFPEKIAVAVFLTAFMPDTTSPPSHVLNKIDLSKLMDTELKTLVVPEKAEPVTTMLFGPEFMAKSLYQLCSPEVIKFTRRSSQKLCNVININGQDLALGKSLVRVTSLFLEDLSKMPAFTEERYGSVPKVYIVCGRDEAISVEYQRWMIQRTPVKEVMEIEGADHMAMLSSPVELFRCLARIVDKYGRTMPCTI
ncbi:hypothetical protein HPP92_016194 [Vanilla planifolia]|uniref:AB hydrolase-1 domain-containing protein n=1 Tax=Vanilla planifolia TaxID=51239 RepID=A0A835QN68_VANPL|nr:hypothetical protein HPP92_016194 [Vanilla planifolia]